MSRHLLSDVLGSDSPAQSLSFVDILKSIVTSGALTTILGFIAAHAAVVGNPIASALIAGACGLAIDLLHKFADGANPPAPAPKARP